MKLLFALLSEALSAERRRRRRIVDVPHDSLR